MRVNTARANNKGRASLPPSPSLSLAGAARIYRATMQDMALFSKTQRSKHTLAPYALIPNYAMQTLPASRLEIMCSRCQ